MTIFPEKNYPKKEDEQKKWLALCRHHGFENWHEFSIQIWDKDGYDWNGILTYDKYKDWFNRKYSKLAKVLE